VSCCRATSRVAPSPRRLRAGDGPGGGVHWPPAGPGATNLAHGHCDAYMDSVPLVAITGQVVQAMIGKGGLPGNGHLRVTLPIVKHSYLITDINDIPRIVKEAFYLAQTGRPGPVAG